MGRSLYNVYLSIEGETEILYALFEGGNGASLDRIFAEDDFRYKKRVAEQIDPGTYVDVELVDIRYGPSSTNALGFLAHDFEFQVVVSAQDASLKIGKFRYSTASETFRAEVVTDRLQQAWQT